MQNRNPSAGTNVESITNADAPTSSPNNAKPHVGSSLSLQHKLMKAEKQLKDYLHYYIGGIVRILETGQEIELTPELYIKIITGQLNAKPVLFDFFNLPLSFWEKLKALKNDNQGCFLSNPTTLIFILKNRYDLFGLINDGLAFSQEDSHFAKKLNRQNPKPKGYYDVPLAFCHYAKEMKINRLEEIKNYRLNEPT
ncbi:MAG: hypothetical protein JST58_09655 [Bacteroidetes bacterium]|nr:hypothetical protein [Bacteroidota bacterium]